MIKKEFIIKELQKANIRYKNVGKNVFIPCPFHLETKPSLSIALEDNGKVKAGVFHCFGCNTSGSWNKLALKLNLTLVDENKQQEKEVYTYPKITSKNKVEDIENLTLEPLPKGFKWKSFNRLFLNRFDAKLLWSSSLKDYFLFLPVYFSNEYYGYIRCKISKKSYGSKYWFNMNNKVLYPFDYVKKMANDTVVLVEGVSDALKLIKNKLPALAILGTSLTKFMLEQLDCLFVSKIVLCLDGDDAGIKAVLGDRSKKGLAFLLEERGFNVKFLFPPQGKDPYDMPNVYINCLKKMIID